MSNYFCFGYGYVAQAFGRALQNRGESVLGTSRNPGAHVLQFDDSHPIPATILSEQTHLLISIPPTSAGDMVLAQHRQDLLSHPWQWIGYLSSTGVYGDYNGDWVDEEAVCHPSDPQTQARLDAEKQWLGLYEKHGVPVHIFRLSGIYGPHRSMVDRVLSGDATRIDKPGQYFSRIHVDDIVQVLLASINHPAPGQIYNLADDEPCSSRGVIEYICDQLNMVYPPLIPFEQADLSPMAHRFYQNNRRVMNTKIKRDLGVVLQYPSYREGLCAALTVL